MSVTLLKDGRVLGFTTDGSGWDVVTVKRSQVDQLAVLAPWPIQEEPVVKQAAAALQKASQGFDAVLDRSGDTHRARQLRKEWAKDDLMADKRPSAHELEQRRLQLEKLCPTAIQPAKAPLPPKPLQIPFLEGDPVRHEVRQAWGRELQAFRDLCRWTCGEAAELTGVSSSEWLEIEAGSRHQPREWWDSVWRRLSEPTDRATIPTVVTVKCTKCAHNELWRRPTPPGCYCTRRGCEGLFVLERPGAVEGSSDKPPVVQPSGTEGVIAPALIADAKKYWPRAKEAIASRKPTKARRSLHCELTGRKIEQGELKHCLYPVGKKSGGRQGLKEAVERLAAADSAESAAAVLKELRGAA